MKLYQLFIKEYQYYIYNKITGTPKYKKKTSNISTMYSNECIGFKIWI